MFATALALFALPGANAYKSVCQGKIQDKLRYGLSKYPIPETLPTGEPGETLGDAICCDSYFRSLAAAEPNGLYSDPKVNLFSSLSSSEPNTFYDSVCGIPLFVVPRGNRTLKEFEAETQTHGWPSFRAAEAVTGNIVIDKTSGEVRSKCGTHLGHNMPDEQGDRYCLDLVCLAGQPSQLRDNGSYIDMATFDGAEGTTHKWKDVNDPVMGGLSTSTFVISSDTKTAVWNGTVQIVPSLKAPGFCNAETDNAFTSKFPDASSFTHLMLKVRTSTPEYAGFKFSFAADTINPQFKSFKGDFNVTGTDWQWVTIPFASGFSNDWSPYTGECSTKDPTGKQHYCCDADHQDKCPTTKNLQSIEQLGLWTEGAQGDFHLEIERIGAGNLPPPSL